MVVLDGYFADIRRVACFCCVIIFLIESFDKIEVFSDKYFCWLNFLIYFKGWSHLKRYEMG